MAAVQFPLSVWMGPGSNPGAATSSLTLHLINLVYLQDKERILFMSKSVVHVLGMGDRLVGKNRDTGNPYDFRRVAFGFTNSYGSADVSVNTISGEDLDALDLQVGRAYVAVVQKIKKDYYITLIEPYSGT